MTLRAIFLPLALGSAALAGGCTEATEDADVATPSGTSEPIGPDAADYQAPTPPMDDPTVPPPITDPMAPDPTMSDPTMSDSTLPPATTPETDGTMNPADPTTPGETTTDPNPQER